MDGGALPKGLWSPAEPPTPCVPRVYDCALFFSALHLASEAWGVAKRACALGTGVDVGQARGFVSVGGVGRGGRTRQAPKPRRITSE
jgi:hypothetical protein